MRNEATARGSEARARDRRLVLIAAGSLALAALLAYANSFSVPLIFDDWVTLLHNPKLRELSSALSPSEDTGLGGRPIANLSFVLNYALTGDSMPGFHAVNLLIHFLAGLALFGVVRRTLLRGAWRNRFTGDASWVALAVAALWMLHPVQTQSVTYVSQRTESLMGLFYLLTLYGFIRATEAGASVWWQVITVVSCFAGMASKEGMVTAPVIVLLYDYAFVSGSFVTAWQQRWRLYLGLAASWIMLALLMRGLHGRGVGFGHGMSAFSYLLIECRAIVHYFSLGLWPAPLVFDYGTDLGTPGIVEALCAAGIGAAGIATLIALRRAPGFGFLGAWFLITLAPTSSVVPIPLQPISENRIYVPTVAVTTALVILFYFAIGRRSLRAFAGAAAALIALTALRNANYHSEVAIWADTVAKRPSSSRAHSNLGQALQMAGRLAEAKTQHELALKIRPNYSEAHANLAAIVGQLGDVDAAVQHSRLATEIDPKNGNAFYNLGVALTQKGDVNGAIAAYEASLRVRPEAAETHSNLALLLLRAGRVPEAMQHSQEALRINPASVDALFVLACGLAMTGRAADSVPVFAEVVRLQPNHVNAYENLGLVLSQLGRTAEAAAAWEAALRINPNSAIARENLQRVRGATPKP